MDKSQLTGKKHHKGRIAALIIVAAAVAAGGFFGWKHFRPEEQAMDEAVPVTESVIRTDIEDIYTATGTVISADEEAVNTSSEGATYPIEEVMVKVGDTVQPGDVLYTLDMTELENDISLQQQQVAIQSQQDAIDRNAAGRAVANAQADSGQQYYDATRNLQRAAEDTNKAIIDQVKTQQDLNEFIVAETKAQTDYDAALAKQSAAEQQYQELQAKVNEAQQASTDAAHQETNTTINDAATEPVKPVEPAEPVKPTDQTAPDYAEQMDSYEKALQAYNDAYNHYVNEELPEYERQKAAFDDYNNKLRAAKQNTEAKAYALTQAQSDLTNYDATKKAADTAVDEAKAALDKAQSDRKAAEEALKTNQASVDSDVRALEDQGSNVNKGNRSVLESEAAARDSVAKAQLANKSSTLEIQDKIRRAQQKLENGVVTAETAGTVTAVNITPGQVYSGSNAVVINNLESMKVTADIDEGHIADLHVGMPVRVKTDSTGETELAGTVSYTALTPVGSGIDVPSSDSDSKPQPVAASTGSSSSTKAKYRITIDLNENSDRLRIGMTARIDFIIDSEKNCLAVPTSCITTDPDGTSFVTLMQQPDQAAMEGGTEGNTEGNATGMTEEIPEEGGTASTDIAAEEGAASEPADAAVEGGTESILTGMNGVQVMIETGISDDYYTQITGGNLKEGDQIQAPSDDMGSMDGDTDMLEGIYG